MEFHAAISRYSSESLETLTSLFPPDSHHFMSGPRRQRRPDFDKVEKWLAATVFSPQSRRLHSQLSSFHPYSPFLSPAPSVFSLFLIVPQYLASRLQPLFCPHFSAYSHSIFHVLCPPPSISCFPTVLHGQFTKSGIHSPFSPRAFNTISNTKPQRLRGREGEREGDRERGRENERLGGKKSTWSQKH